MTDPNALDELLAVCRKHGVTVFTDGHVRIAFAPSGESKQLPAGMVPVTAKAGYRPMTDTERFLFAATDGYVADDNEAVVPIASDPVRTDMKQ